MKLRIERLFVIKRIVLIIGVLCGLLSPSVFSAEPSSLTAKDATKRIWDRNNLVAWEAAPYDEKKRSSEERALMLKRLGFQHYAYLSSTEPWDSKNDVNISQHDIDTEIEAMQKYGINIPAWYFWLNTDDPAENAKVKKTLESFRRHNICPQIWVPHSYAHYPRTVEAWTKLQLLPKGIAWPGPEEWKKASEAEKQVVNRAYDQFVAGPKTPEAQKQRVNREAKRIAALVKLAAPYGCKVNLYNHRGWYGMVENQLAILERLKEMGITDVGIVYNFSHSRDRLHDDSKNFPQLWGKMKSHVIAVNIFGLGENGDLVYPSQGNRELDMMRIIEESGWRGFVGVLPLFERGDTEESLRKVLVGIDWLAAELKEAGSGGPRPNLSAVTTKVN